MAELLSRRQFLLGAAGLSAVSLTACRSATTSHTAGVGGYFRDVARDAGIHFSQGHRGRTLITILDIIGTGCAFLDYDRDGWLDILLVGQPSCALYRNRHDGTFEDVTEKTGLAAHGHWLGCAVGDFNNDGYPDLYVSGYECGALYRNRGDGTFDDVTRAYGIQPRRWETSCGFIDANGDGLLDLYVARYVLFGPNSKQFCQKGGITTACGPLVYPPDRGSLYLNTGRGFVERTAGSGLEAQSGNGLGVTFADYDNSGRISIALANDSVPGNLFENLGNGHFRDVGKEAGIAFDAQGNVYGGMGIDWGDYNNDGLLDLVVGTYYNQPSVLFQNYGGGVLVDQGVRAGIGQPMAPWVNFGTRFFDYNNDGWLDLIVANGQAQAGLERLGWNMAYHQPLQLFHNSRGRFDIAGEATAGTPFQGRYVGRGLAVGDFDHDGGLDLLIVDAEGSALLLHNEVPRRGNWLEIDLEGKAVPRGGEGAIIRLRSGELKLMRNVTTSGSYLSANPGRVHFGLGPASTATEVTITWPGGSVQRVPNLQANRIWLIRQGEQPVRRF